MRSKFFRIPDSVVIMALGVSKRYDRLYGDYHNMDGTWVKLEDVENCNSFYYERKGIGEDEEITLYVVF